MQLNSAEWPPINTSLPTIQGYPTHARPRPAQAATFRMAHRHKPAATSISAATELRAARYQQIQLTQLRPTTLAGMQFSVTVGLRIYSRVWAQDHQTPAQITRSLDTTPASATPPAVITPSSAGWQVGQTLSPPLIHSLVPKRDF